MKRTSGVFWLFFIFFVSFFLLCAKETYAYNPNPATVGPFEYSGTVKVYYKIQPGTGSNRIIITRGPQTQTVDLPACTQGCSGLVDSKTTSFVVGPGDSVSVKLINTNGGGYRDGLGWTDPTSQWTCGWAGSGDGVHPFDDLETLAESGGFPIYGRQCWEDWTDNDFNDVAVIFSYGQASVPPAYFTLDYFQVLLGKRPSPIPIISGYEMKVCPRDIDKLNWNGPYPCIIPWTDSSPTP